MMIQLFLLSVGANATIIVATVAWILTETSNVCFIAIQNLIFCIAISLISEKKNEKFL